MLYECMENIKMCMAVHQIVFLEIYHKVDIVIAKGQANFESLSEEKKNIYFLLMVKCGVISQYIGALEKSLVCLSQRKRR